MIRAEFILASAPEYRVARWCALGETWLDIEYPPGDEKIFLCPVNGRLKGPSIRLGIPIDLSLPQRISYPKAGLHRPQNPNCADMALIVNRLNQAVEIVENISKVCVLSVKELVSNIVLRTDRLHPFAMRSASSAAALGRTVIVNAQCGNVASLAEALVHEAIHTAVSIVELNCPLLSDPTAGEKAIIKSPWTGSELPLHAFLHACMVWFGLLNFWRLSQRGTTIFPHARSRVQEIETGFARLELKSCVNSYASIVSISGVKAIERISESVFLG
ncbi:aKG-HExxH-type peptide beta-hydroxylase [Cupriavidus yeoncheonensis]|uniref:aKG-HExxH-type peptide beta-hydroxylase n=1 Tax=Cupriavidus yeoncheonensis TaxID=1462994 RepID=UPI001BA8876F|nr:HEXXH motif-containing putative peptide modification protein [Cupriavidus yeoncheonensis]